MYDGLMLRVELGNVTPGLVNECFQTAKLYAIRNGYDSIHQTCFAFISTLNVWARLEVYK